MTTYKETFPFVYSLELFFLYIDWSQKSRDFWFLENKLKYLREYLHSYLRGDR